VFEQTPIFTSCFSHQPGLRL